MIFGKAIVVLADTYTQRFVGEVSARSADLAGIVEVGERIGGLYEFSADSGSPELLILEIRTGSGSNWLLGSDLSKSISEDSNGLIWVFGGNSVSGTAIQGNHVLVLDLSLVRPPMTLGYDSGELLLFNVDAVGNYVHGAISVLPMSNLWR